MNFGRKVLTHERISLTSLIRGTSPYSILGSEVYGGGRSNQKSLVNNPFPSYFEREFGSTCLVNELKPWRSSYFDKRHCSLIWKLLKPLRLWCAIRLDWANDSTAYYSLSSKKIQPEPPSTTCWVWIALVPHRKCVAGSYRLSDGVCKETHMVEEARLVSSFLRSPSNARPDLSRLSANRGHRR